MQQDNSDRVQPIEPEDYSGEISAVAYSYWESRGREDGHDVEDWLAAEQEVMRRHRVQLSEIPARQRTASAA